jgi:hypothetical protein
MNKPGPNSTSMNQPIRSPCLGHVHVWECYGVHFIRVVISAMLSPFEAVACVIDIKIIPTEFIFILLINQHVLYIFIIFTIRNFKILLFK